MMQNIESYVPGSKLPLFPYNRGWETQRNSRGLYIHYKDSVIKGGRSPIPKKRDNLDHGIYGIVVQKHLRLGKDKDALHRNPVTKLKKGDLKKNISIFCVKILIRLRDWQKNWPRISCNGRFFFSVSIKKTTH